MEIIKTILVAHSRIAETAQPGQKYSEVWTEISRNFLKEGENLTKAYFDVIALRKSYHDLIEFVENVERAIEEKPQVLVLPFTPMEESIRGRLVESLKNFTGKIIAVNVPPAPEYREALEIVGYVGMNEFRAGYLAAQWLDLHSTKISEILILKHEKGHYGFSLRINGVEEYCKKRNLPVFIKYVGVENDEQQRLTNANGIPNCGIVTLGVRGTEAAMKYLPQFSEFPVVGMDLNEKVRAGITEGKVLATLIQHLHWQGKLAARMAVNPLTDYTEIYYCGPTLVDRNNIQVF